MPPQPPAHPLKVRYEPAGASEVLAFDSVEGDACTRSGCSSGRFCAAARCLRATRRGCSAPHQDQGQVASERKRALDSARGLS